MILPKNLKEILVDVTKAPYFCDNTGKEDCTEALCRALDDILIRDVNGIQKAIDDLNALSDPNARISFEIRKNNGTLNVIFPEDLPDTRIIYFPKGTYLVSDTIGHSLENLRNVFNGKRLMECSRKIYIRGEEKNSTVIKLKDNCNGFEFGNSKPILSYFRMEKSNIAQTNSLMDITIDCGKGNPGAVGLRFHSSNSGAVRNVAIRSSDENYRGYAGIHLDRGMEGVFTNISVTGFDYGVKMRDSYAPVVFENIELENQNQTGFLATDSNIIIRNMKSYNGSNPIRIDGFSSQAAIFDSEFVCNIEGGKGCVTIADGDAYINNVTTKGYQWPLIIGSNCDHFDPIIKEIWTSDVVYNLFNKDRKSLKLPYESVPEEFKVTCKDDIAFVDDFGACGDGNTDSTEAIQKAFNSGKPAIYFGCGHYFVNDSITVPSSVKLVDFMYCDFYSGKNLENAKNKGLFVVNVDSDEHITFKNVFTWEKFFGYFRFIEHSAKRCVVMRDLHTQCAGMYFNTVEGSKVYFDNVACTNGGGDFCSVIPCELHGQKVWAKNLNPERGDVAILNDHSDLYILGIKSEEFGGRPQAVAIKTINGGNTEGYGLYSGIGIQGTALYINEESNVNLMFTVRASSIDKLWDIFMRETIGGVTKELKYSDALRIGKFYYKVPGYTGTKE